MMIKSKKYCANIKGGRSASKFRKSQICKFAVLNFFRFLDLPQMWKFADLRFPDHLFFQIADLGFADCKSANRPSANVAICGFAISGSYIFLDLRWDLQTQLFFAVFFCKSSNTYFYPYQYKLKMLLFKFKNGFWLLEQV